MGVIVLIILVVLLAGLVAAFLYRLTILRRGGTAAILRMTPAAGGSGWRHGVIRYGDNTLVFFKLSSLRPGPDHRMSRQGIEVGERRTPRNDEFDIMSDEIAILELTDQGLGYEIALDRGALTAFMSWLESRPSGRSRRGRPAA
ncbi:DUF2550 domain-containing protein [Rhodococcus sp. RS1C4]|nr:DUF2550 domain-containing protein [Rhodococcus sp. RS1C4]OZC51891.1 DUF2550 domain-containing protein [Rhodococcus sp. 06-621-2]OZC76401.1 DUF2550 domain-containing protein [Rhodococcus sp. 06-418-1B]OZD13366.1 DUF2550 domain-containing protein [Rhodococcus sp. 06-156-3C]OZD14008.1 DUF2550 domain-containing protein [Rhodococcus sp. 06-156-4C]OZD28713.1 DUF2550 domain-containing protein [Rhodococcus sp. 06-156-3]OZD28813.1 DUF2550 domain-containing protein [Rhodococcus sp. 06-156-4a]OZD349